MFFWLNFLLTAQYLLTAVQYIIFFFTSAERSSTVARWALFSGIGLHVALLIWEGVRVHRMPLTTVFEAMSVLSFALALGYLIIEFRIHKKALGSFVFPIVFIFQLISSIGYRMNVLDSSIIRMPVFGIHTISSVSGYAFFIYSMILGILYLHLFSELKRKKFDIAFDRLPPLEVLDRLNSICVLIGFVLLSIGIAGGTYMAIVIWRTFPLFDPKIFLSVVLWIIFLASIILRYVVKWSGRKMSYISLVGFFLIVLIFLVEILTQFSVHRF
ncbi:MAG: hypothetical protein CMN78_02000 [Spirochaetales bacterium]|nr:hypothetical protein [Spirochaetales bacterium]